MNIFKTKNEYEEYGIKCNTRFETEDANPTRCFDRQNNNNQKKWNEFLDFYDKIKSKNDALYYIDSLLNAYSYNYRIKDCSVESLQLAIYTLFTKPTKQMKQLLNIDSCMKTIYSVAQNNNDRGDNLQIAYLYSLKALVMVSK